MGCPIHVFWIGESDTTGDDRLKKDFSWRRCLLSVERDDSHLLLGLGVHSTPLFSASLIASLVDAATRKSIVIRFLEEWCLSGTSGAPLQS